MYQRHDTGNEAVPKKSPREFKARSNDRPLSNDARRSRSPVARYSAGVRRLTRRLDAASLNRLALAESMPSPLQKSNDQFDDARVGSALAITHRRRRGRQVVL